LHQINTRQRSGGAGAADFASSPALENATKFIRPSKITSQAISSARDSVAKNVEAAQSKVTNSMAFKLKSYVSGVVLDIATWHVKKKIASAFVGKGSSWICHRTVPWKISG
jgi:hypothetical protein